MPSPALRIVDRGLDTAVEWRWFCGYCAASPPDGRVPSPSGRVCASCGLGVMLETRADAIPTDRDAFLIVDGRLLTQAASRNAQRLLAITEQEVIDTPVSKLLIAAGAESPHRTGFADVIARAAEGLEPAPAGSVVRPWNTFGVRMRAKIAMCGPPRGALIVLGNECSTTTRRSSNVIPLRAIR
jgi:hypothetical protein